MNDQFLQDLEAYRYRQRQPAPAPNPSADFAAAMREQQARDAERQLAALQMQYSQQMAAPQTGAMTGPDSQYIPEPAPSYQPQTLTDAEANDISAQLAASDEEYMRQMRALYGGE